MTVSLPTLVQLDAAAYWAWLGGRETTSARENVEEILLAPWSPATFGQMRIDEIDLLRGSFGPDRLDGIVGGWPSLLAEIVERRAELPKQDPGAFAESFTEGLDCRAWLADARAVTGARPVLEAIATVGMPVPAAILPGLADADPPLIERVVVWGLGLGLLRGTREALQIDPVVARALG
jgi:hypothetical protein